MLIIPILEIPNEKKYNQDKLNSDSYDQRADWQKKQAEYYKNNAERARENQQRYIERKRTKKEKEFDYKSARKKLIKKWDIK